MRKAAATREERLLVLAPTGRDALLTCTLLEQAGHVCEKCTDVVDLCRRAGEGAAALLIAEEVLVPSGMGCLSRLLERQEPWSDFPILLFTGQGATVQAHAPTVQLLADLGNVTLLDRPLRPITMISAARAALRARRHQYAARAELRRQERAVRQRDQFLAMLGHELRNPLGAILMTMDLVDLGEDLPRHRAVLRRQAQHLARLVDDLLDVSRVTSGKIPLQRSVVDLKELMQRSLHSMDAAIHAQGLAASLTTPPRPVMVEGDSIRLEQVVANLLTNAIKYTPPGGRLELGLSVEGTEAVMRFRDTGVGMGKETIPRIFDLFEQAESSLDRAKGGMGIGLTLVRTLVELHGGSVQADSPGIDQGSQFTVRLPARDAEVATELPSPRESLATPAQEILVIEDNSDTREALKALLEHDGHHVDAVADGLTGVEHALGNTPPPRVLLVDIGLPGLDGYAVARKVRAARGRNVFLVAFTGYGQPEDRRRALEAGFDVHFTKPVDLVALHALLARPEVRSV